MDPTFNDSSEEIRDEDLVDTQSEDQNAEDRIDALEDTIALQNEQITEIANEQTKIVEILEQMSEKLNRPQVDEIEEKVEEAPDEEEVKNDIEESLEASKDEAGSEEETAEDAEKIENSAESEDEDEEKESEEESEESEESEEEDSEEDKDEEEDDKEKEVENSEEAPKTEEEPAEEEVQENNNIKENTMTPEELNALKEQIKNDILDSMVKEPEVKETEEAEEKVDNSIASNWKVRYNDQVAAAWDAYRLHNAQAFEKLNKINAYNASLKVENDAGNGPITIESLDSFVLPPEMDTLIHGKRTRYSDFLGNLDYATTDRLTFAYVTRVGDINMRNVSLCDDGEDGNLKPIETYGLEQGVAQMEELAAVTPICDNATKYMAVDILQDIAAGYRNDYDRKLAQLAILRIQQAINKTGQAVEFDPQDSVDALVQFIKATTTVSDGVVNGKFVFNAKTKAKLVEYLFRAATNGDLGRDAMTTGDVPTIFGYPYVVVPNDLMPTLGETGDPIVFQATNNQTGQLESVTIKSPVFYGDLDEFRGKVSGALKYDVSADASYEVINNGVKETRSAWQRNELVLRGSFLRGGYIADATVFAGLEPKA